MTPTAILILAAGTYAFRAAGPLLRAHLTSRVRRSRPASPTVPSRESDAPVGTDLGEGAGGSGMSNSPDGSVGLAGRGGRTREVALPPRVSEVLSVAATVLLVALVATASLTDGGRFAGVALPAGVLVGGVLAWRKAPFVVVVIVAAGVAAGLRALGVP